MMAEEGRPTFPSLQIPHVWEPSSVRKKRRQWAQHQLPCIPSHATWKPSQCSHHHGNEWKKGSEGGTAASA
ncbi:hypothetical protein GHT09_007308 [Marmota monax]|uniref:Uncharacterized protein n=1 Tax=Marmota monax TaxID=9995 RepID=A0A834V2M4_MARMO|nr:hypothetical protein GHT09_007308 [Marmota monax]KAF7481382.1 hypothetical protein GHT09_007308 [Marmota monax]